MGRSIAQSSISESYGSYAELNYESESREAPATSSQENLYGRSKEMSILLKAFESLQRTNQPQTVIVHGKSGSGKSALVDSALRSLVVNTGGYFISGKYFQNAAFQEPYSAIMAALSDLCDLIVQSGDFDQVKQREIADALGHNVRPLETAISSLTSLTGLITNSESNGEVPSIAKFKVACKAFLHALACDEHPIVVFLDDVQWADEGSAALIQTLLQDADLKNVMFILAYRDEESEVAEAMLKDVRKPTKIALSNLDADDILCIVTDIMDSASNQVKLLSDLVAKRTDGNPFHIAMFMDTIQNEGLLIFDDSTRSWLFNVDEIQQAVMVSETLADLLTRKIVRLSSEIEETLKVASLLGYHFEESTLLYVVSIVFERKQITSEKLAIGGEIVNKAAAKVLASLSEAVKEGFIEMTSDGYQFAHDKLQTAFQHLIDESEEARLHALIGEAFFAHRNKELANVYRAAVHLNMAPQLQELQQRARLARINLEAAKYCMEVSAFDRAVTVLQAGLGGLSIAERWSAKYISLTLETMEALARTQMIIGEFEACKQTTKEALCHPMTLSMKITLQLIDVEVRMAGGEIESSLDMANLAVETLGVKMPRKANTWHMLTKLMKVKWLLKNKSDEDILNLPLTQDPLAAQAIRLLMNLCLFYLAKDEPVTALYSALLATELTLKKGLSQHSSGAFTFYGIAEVALGNIDRAYRFGKLALTMLNRMDSREAECSTVGFAITMLLFRREPLHELIGPLYQAANSGFKHHGDIVYASYCFVYYHTLHVQSGVHLASVEESMRKSYATISELGQGDLLLLSQPAFQFVLNMQNDDGTSWDNISLLSGEIMNERHYFDRAVELSNTILSVIGYVWKARMASEFGNFSSAASVYEECTRSFGNDAITLSQGAASYYLDVARTYYSLYKLSGRRQHLRQGRKHLALLKRLEADGYPEVTAKVTFLVVQEASIKYRSATNESMLRDAYTRGLEDLADTKNVILEALLNEYAAFDFASRGLSKEAEGYFDRALYLYKYGWGATAKHNYLMEQKHMLLLSGLGESTAPVDIPRSVKY